jgi:hypothetical protein
MSSNNQPRHAADVEGVLPAVAAAPIISNGPGTVPIDIDEKGHSELVEDIKDATFDDPNSPEAILHRYPLLRNKSEEELAKLNHRVRRRMWVFWSADVSNRAWSLFADV